MAVQENPEESRHYQGEGGEAYFASYKNGDLMARGQLNVRTKFARHVKPEDTVLDFGCGSGTVLACLDCKQKIGVELNPAAREESQRHGVTPYISLDQVPNEVADVAISNHALEHVANPLRTLKQLREKLTPTGKLVLVVPIDDWRAQREPNPTDKDHHLYTWTPLLLGNLLGEAGYRVESIQVFTHAWFPRWEQWMPRLPTAVFDAVCSIYAWGVKRRQLVAVATRT